MSITTTQLRKLLNSRFGGQLQAGPHSADDFLPDIPDIRALNGAFLSARERTKAMLPLLATMAGWGSWSVAQRQEWSRAVARRTICEILPVALRAVGLPACADACADAPNLAAAAQAATRAAQAAQAAQAAEAATRAAQAAQAAQAATRAAADAAWAVWAGQDAQAATRAAAGDVILTRACEIWREAAAVGACA